MLQPVQDWKRDNLPLALFLSADSHSLRDLLMNALMRPRRVEEHNVFFDHPIQLTFAQNQKVVQTLSLNAAQKSFAYCIRSLCPIGCAQDLHSRGLGHGGKPRTELAIVVADQEARARTGWRRFSQLLRDLGVGWMPRHSKVHHAARA